MPYKAYKGFIDEATALKGRIVTDAKGIPSATFDSVEIAEKFATTWRANYNANRKVSVVATVVPSQKPKASKGKASPSTKELSPELAKWVETHKGDDNIFTQAYIKSLETKATASSTKKTAPRKAKGNAFDYSVIKGESKKDKNRALHAMLVSKGIGDSRTPEYQAVWNARPWAK
jgi:hypothetical protein